jgi:hypothetical protein
MLLLQKEDTFCHVASFLTGECVINLDSDSYFDGSDESSASDDGGKLYGIITLQNSDQELWVNGKRF